MIPNLITHAPLPRPKQILPAEEAGLLTANAKKARKSNRFHKAVLHYTLRNYLCDLSRNFAANLNAEKFLIEGKRQRDQ